LNAGTPARLVCRRGTWILEIERLVPIDRNVFRPATQRFEGTEAVLQYLKRTSDNPALANAASQLIRATRAEDCAFEALDGEWVPSHARVKPLSSHPSAAAGVAAAVAELRAELTLLRASHNGLCERVLQLEAKLSGVQAARETISFTSVPPYASPKISEAAQAMQPSEAPGLERIRAEAASLPAQAPALPVAGPSLPAEEEAPAEPGVKLPSALAVSGCLRALLGRPLPARQKRPLTFPPEPEVPCWFSILVDDSDREVGAIVADLAATITLGGALMMLPEPELDAQRAAQTPSEDVISAMDEVANNLTVTINQQPDGAHVRARPSKPLTPDSLEWAKTPTRALELELDREGGRLYLLVR